MPKVTIDGKEIEVAPGTSVIQAAELAGVRLPFGPEKITERIGAMVI